MSVTFRFTLNVTTQTYKCILKLVVLQTKCFNKKLQTDFKIIHCYKNNCVKVFLFCKVNSVISVLHYSQLIFNFSLYKYQNHLMCEFKFPCNILSQIWKKNIEGFVSLIFGFILNVTQQNNININTIKLKLKGCKNLINKQKFISKNGKSFLKNQKGLLIQTVQPK